MDKVRGAVLIADEAQLTLRLELDYNVSKGGTKVVASTVEGKRYIEAMKEVYETTAQLRIDAQQNKDLIVLRDGKGVMTDGILQTEYYRKIVGEGLSRVNEIIERQGLSFDQALDVYLKTPQTDAQQINIQQLAREKIAAFDAVIKVMADVKDTNYGLQVIDGVERVVPQDSGEYTGRQYSGEMEALAYEMVGKDLLGSTNKDLSRVTVSAGGESTNYAEFLQNFSEIYGFTGTPDLLARQFDETYGVKIGKSSIDQTSFVFGVLNPATGKLEGSLHPITKFTRAKNIAEVELPKPTDQTAQNYVIEDPSVSSKEIVDVIRKRNSGVDVAVISSDGKYTIFPGDGSQPLVF
ncbi:MAG: hypothetical protein AAB874_04400, partial [Patescibacteria group bacterium]